MRIQASKRAKIWNWSTKLLVAKITHKEVKLESKNKEDRVIKWYEHMNILGGILRYYNNDKEDNTN